MHERNQQITGRQRGSACIAGTAVTCTRIIHHRLTLRCVVKRPANMFNLEHASPGHQRGAMKDHSSRVYSPPPCGSSLDDACTDLNERKHVGRRSFLDSHEDELVPRAKSLGDEAACLVVEMCTNEELSGNKRMTKSEIVGEVDVRRASGVDRPVA